MYWQKRFDRVDPDKELEEHILSIRKEHKDFRYRRVLALLKKDGILINKKKVQRIMQNLDYRLHNILARLDATTLTRVILVELHLIESIVDLILLLRTKR